MNVEMFSVSNLRYQLFKLIQIIEKDLEQGVYVEDYYVVEGNCMFLDHSFLEDFLIVNEIKNEITLIEICEMCKKIIDFWNTKCLELNPKQLEHPYKFFSDNRIINRSTKDSLYCLIVDKNKIQVISNEKGFDYFLSTYSNARCLNLQFFATKCNFIVNTITKVSPNIYKKVSEECVSNENNSEHSNIFCNNGFKLFEYILLNHIPKKDERGRYACISFYYWKMSANQKYIHQKPEVFKKWFCEKYEDSFEKIKTLNNVADQQGRRERDYSMSLDWFSKL